LLVVMIRGWWRSLLWSTLFHKVGNYLVIIGEGSNRVPLRTHHKEVYQRADYVGKEDEQQPKYFTTASDPCICEAVDEHPYPKNGYSGRYNIYS